MGKRNRISELRKGPHARRRGEMEGKVPAKEKIAFEQGRKKKGSLAH